MSGFLSGGKSKSKSEFNQNVYGPQGDALKSLYGGAANLFGGNNYQTQMQQGVDQSQGALDSMQNPWQQQLQGGVYKDMGLQKSLMGSLNQSLNNPSAMQDINSMIMGGEGNNYADAMKGQYVEDANRAQQNMLGNLDARAAASGMSGGARAGVAQGRGMDDINRNLQQNLASTGFNAFDKDLDRKLAIAQQADQGTLARQGMMQGMLGQQQGAQNQGLNYGNNMFQYGQQQQMMPWQQFGQYAQGVGAPTVLNSGSSSAKGMNFGMGGGMK